MPEVVYSRDDFWPWKTDGRAIQVENAFVFSKQDVGTRSYAQEGRVSDEEVVDVKRGEKGRDGERDESG
jgi:hypothetical protein